MVQLIEIASHLVQPYASSQALYSIYGLSYNSFWWRTCLCRHGLELSISRNLLNSFCGGRPGADTWIHGAVFLILSLLLVFFSADLFSSYFSRDRKTVCRREKREMAKWTSLLGYEILFELEDHDAYESSSWIVTSRATSSWIITSTIFAAVCSPSTSAFRGDSSLSIPRACTRADLGLASWTAHRSHAHLSLLATADRMGNHVLCMEG